MPKQKPEDVEAAEVGAIETAVEGSKIDAFFAVGDARDAMLEVIRSAVDWSKFDEQRQRDINAAVDGAARVIVQKIAEAMAGEGKHTIPATIEQVVIKDGLKIVLKAPLDLDNIPALAEAKRGLLAIVNTEAFDHSRAPARVDPDQPELLSSETDDLVNAADPVILEHADAFEHPEQGDCEVSIDLKQGMIMLTPTSGDGDKIELREATSEELKRERERIADFGDSEESNKVTVPA